MRSGLVVALAAAIVLSCEPVAGPIPTPAPAAPTSVSATFVPPNAVTLAWTNASDGVSAFEVQEQKDGESTWRTVATLAPTQTQESRTGLTVGMYHYRVRACANTSCSAFSAEVSVFVPAATPLPPNATAHSATSVTRESAELSGTVSPNGAVTEAWFEWSTNAALNGAQSSARQSVGSGTDTIPMRHTLAQLAPATTYYFRLFAENANGTARSTILSFTTAAAPPAAPSNLAAASTSPSQIELHWTDNSANETEFRVESRLVSDSVWTLIATLAGNSTGYTHSGIAANTSRSYRVQACNAAGCSAFSNTANATTGSAVAAPVTTTALASEITTTSATLNGSVNPGGAQTTAWFEYSSDPGLANATTTATRTLPADTVPASIATPLTGLAVGALYYYRAVGMNSQGTTRGAILSFTTQSTSQPPPPPPPPGPAAPDALSAVAVSQNGINLSWHDNSSDENGFVVEYHAGASITWVIAGSVSANTTSFAHTGLAESTTYTYRVRACNAAGCSANTSEASATTPATPVPSGFPSVTTGVGGLLSPTTARIHGSVYGNSLPTTAWFEYGADPALAGATRSADMPVSNVFSPVEMQLDLNPVTPGQTYYFRISAQNSVGTAVGQIHSFVASAPLPPANMRAVFNPDNSITVSWDNPNGTSAGSCQAYHVIDNYGAPNSYVDSCSAAPSGGSFVTPVVNLNADYVYHYYMRFCSSICSPYSEATATTRHVDPPSNLTATGTTTAVQLAWTYGSDPSGFFQVYRWTATNTFPTIIVELVPSARSFTDTNVTLNTTYYYKMAIRSGSGVTNFSNEAHATPSPNPANAPTVTTGTATPYSPTTGHVTGQVTPNLLATTAWFEWGTSATLAGATRSPDIAVGDGANPVSIAADISPLDPGQTYYYRVVAQNTAGTTQGAIRRFTASVPPPPVNLQAVLNPDNSIRVTWDSPTTDGQPLRCESRRSIENYAGPVNVPCTTNSDGSGSILDLVGSLHADYTYHYFVKLCNGFSCSSNAEVSVVTQHLDPPTNLTATGTSTSVQLNWSYPSDPPGFFQVYRIPSTAPWPNTTGGPIELVASARGYLDTNVTPNTTYRYKIAIRAGYSLTDFSNEVTVLATSNPATAPTATTGNGFIQSNQTQGTLNGEIVPNRLATTAWFEWGTSPTLTGAARSPDMSAGDGVNPVPLSFNISPLTPGATYYYRIVGQNSAGTTQGAIRSVVNAVPAPPTNVQAVFNPDNTISVTWNAPSSDGQTRSCSVRVVIDNYGTPNSSTNPCTETLTGGSASTPVINLRADYVYHYYVQVCNSVGCSAATETTVTTQHVDAPTNLTATVAGNSVQLAWSYPSDPPAGSVFQVYRTPSSGQVIVELVPSARSFTDTTVQRNVTYTYKIAIRRGSGVTDFSNAVQVTVP